MAEKKDDKKQEDVHELTDRVLKDGGLLVMMYFDMPGQSPDTIQSLLVDFLAGLADDPLAVYTYGEVEEPREYEHEGGKMYSTYAEVKILVGSIRDLAALVLKYAPVGVEILKPHEVKLTIGDLQELMMDLSTFSTNFTTMYMQKGLDEGKKREYAENLKLREETGKRLIEEGKLKESGKKEKGKK